MLVIILGLRASIVWGSKSFLVCVCVRGGVFMISARCVCGRKGSIFPKTHMTFIWNEKERNALKGK